MILKNLLKILFVEDVPSDVDLAVLELRKEKLTFEYTTVCTRIDLEKALREFNPDLIISDYMMPSFNGLQALKISKEFNRAIPFILYTGSVNEETAVECIKAGAEDYVIKEHSTRLPFAVKEAIEQVRIFKEKRASELLLHENEQKLQSIFSAAPVGIGLVVNSVLLEMNDTLCRMTGYARKELIGKSSEILFATHEEFLAARIDKCDKISEDVTGSVETLFKTKDGIILNVILSSSPLDKDDCANGVTFTIMDITERKKSEEALRESELKYRRIFENVQDVYYETSIDGIILELSPSIELLTGGLYKMEDLIGRSIYDFYTDPYERQLIVNELKTKGAVRDFEITLNNRDGSITPCSVSAKLLSDKDGNPDKIIGSMRDITDRKNASDALRIAKERAEMSDKLKTEFLNNISHEVRTPLNGILGFAEIISLQDLSEEEKKDSLAMLFESSNRLLNTITNYMDISLITSGSLSVHIKEFFPVPILKRIYNNFESACQNKKLQLLLEMPEHADEFVISSDPEICQKIISHLLDNAVKFTEKGTIRFGFSYQTDQVEFFVKDTGIGIKKESFDIIFETFVKEGQRSYNVSEGSGLGLSIARGMTDAIGGKIWLESEPGKGSGFFLGLPLRKVSAESSPVNPRIGSSKSLNGSMILVAEDDDTNFYYLNALISRETDVKVLHASNGREAIELFRLHPDIKLILMDMKMPEIDGFEATRQIKLLNADVHIIAITAFAMSGDEERIIAAGCDGYLSKPINKKSLLEKIGGFIKI
jgi:PAS domain S-box-containing protein